MVKSPKKFTNHFKKISEKNLADFFNVFDLRNTAELNLIWYDILEISKRIFHQIKFSSEVLVLQTSHCVFSF